MRRLFTPMVVVALAAGALWLTRRLDRPSAPDPQAVLQQMREVARLETLDVEVYRKISFAPDPGPSADVWHDLWQWARYNLRRPEGRAIVFATVHLALDVKALDQNHLRVRDHDAWVVLPPLVVSVELKPAETEIIQSNLDSAETAALLARAADAFRRDAEGDAILRQKAEQSARRALTGLLKSLGFVHVYFVTQLPEGALPG